jgi:hypothetical protein
MGEVSEGVECVVVVGRVGKVSECGACVWKLVN